MKRLLRTAFLGSGLLLAPAFLGAFDGPLPGPKVGDKAPLFQIKTLEMDDFTFFERLRAVQAKKGLIVIDFWATWCAPCKREFPVFQKMKDELAAKNVTFLAISIDEKRKDLWTFVKENKYDFPIAHDPNAFQAGKKYGAGSGAPLPQLFIIDDEGIIRYRHAGEIKNLEAALKAQIEALRPGSFPAFKGVEAVTGESAQK